MEAVTLSSKGQLVIPKAIGDHLQAKAGTVFSVRLEDGEIRLRQLPVVKATQLSDVAGCLAKPGRKCLSDVQTQVAILAQLKARNAA